MNHLRIGHHVHHRCLHSEGRRKILEMAGPHHAHYRLILRSFIDQLPAKLRVYAVLRIGPGIIYRYDIVQILAVGKAAVRRKRPVFNIHVRAVHVPVKGCKDGVAGSVVIGYLNCVKIVATDLLQLLDVLNPIVLHQSVGLFRSRIAHPTRRAVNRLPLDRCIEPFHTIHICATSRNNINASAVTVRNHPDPE